MSKYITPEQYTELEEDEAYMFIGEFKKYKKKRESNYCNECGHFTDYSWHDVGIGKPYRYRELTGIERIYGATINNIVNNINNSQNIFFEKVLDKKPHPTKETKADE